MVGGGAVGQVYGLSLLKAGAALAYLEQPAAADRLRQALETCGLPLYQISFFKRRDPIPYRLEHYRVFTTPEECRRFTPDQIWFTTPSQVYYTDWFHAFLKTVPSERVVCFVPEGSRPEFLLGGLGDRVIFGGTTFMAWQGDLGGKQAEPDGVKFWLPPLAIPLSGAPSACSDVAQLLKKGGFRVTVGAGESRAQAATTAVMTAFVAGLELSGWSLRSYRRSPWLKRAAAACREAVTSQLREANTLAKALLSVPFLSACFTLAAACLPLLFPFDLERYLKFHYLKTREQTLTLLRLYEKDGEVRGLPTAHIQSLLQALGTGRT